MRVFLAGATGAIGRRLLPLLVRSGHFVTGTTRSADKAAGLRAAGADAVVVDALDAAAIEAAILRARPEVIIHELTAIPATLDMRKFASEFHLTNRLRTEGTMNLLAAALSAGVHRFVAQSFGAWPYARTGGPVKTENDPLDSEPPSALRETLEAIRYLESAVLEAADLEGLALRYGWFYGPGTGLGENGGQVEMVRHRRLPVIGGGTGVWSFIHIDDAAIATLAAVEHGAPGIYNVADDEPAAASEWIPELAKALGAKPPLRLPGWLGRLAIGEQGLMMMTSIRGMSNAKAKRELGWHPRWPVGAKDSATGCQKPAPREDWRCWGVPVAIKPEPP
ncbi:MAG TPA: NAD(P)-dependent oxidoreductase [Bryobacteraceae bacterium]|jgi:nucleoside-diphosphate-sugar epimerase|nr:NAD(P)-dependent oxidoreductase [Bryobacteraceae bacterium]